MERSVIPLLGKGSLIPGGAEGSRTPDLLIANEALYQLSYGPRSVLPVRSEDVEEGAMSVGSISVCQALVSGAAVRLPPRRQVERWRVELRASWMQFRGPSSVQLDTL